MLAELPEQGAIGEGTPFRLYYLIAAQKKTGRLVIIDGQDFGWELYFRRGVPHHVRTTSPNLGLGRYLLAHQILGHEELSRAQAVLREEGGELLDVLSRTTRVDVSELFKILAGYGRALLVRALVVDGGSYRWEVDAAAPGGAAPLGETWALVCEAGRRLSTPEVLRRLGGRVHQPAMRASDGLLNLEELGLNAHELRIVSTLDGTRSLAQIAAGSPQDSDAIYRTAYFLAAMGMASFAQSASPASTEAPVGAANAGEAPFHEAFTPSPANALRADAIASSIAATQKAQSPRPKRRSPDATEVMAFLESLKEKDHFEVLGLDRKATSAEVKRAYFGLARIHHPDTAPPGDAEIRRAKEQITARLNEAYDVLGSDVRRADYLADLEITGGPTEIDIANLLEAERRFRDATLRVKARQYKEALVDLDDAIRLNDQEGEFYAWRAFARFSATPDKRQVAQLCFEEIDLALEKSPNCAVAHLFAGRIATVLGDVQGAMKYYKRCLALEAGNVEAKRELRLLESRNAR